MTNLYLDIMQVGGNIEAVFTKFVSEGKFTIRFKEPAHDLCVKADPVLAKTFLQTCKSPRHLLGITS